MLAIRNYGLLWERKFIFWGWPGKAGHLKGMKGKVVVDFRDQSGVYVLYDHAKIPIYAGQAGKGNHNLFNRLREHDDDHLWNRWQYFSWFGLCRATKGGKLSLSDRPERKLQGTIEDALNDIEGVLIHVLEPRLNRQGPKWKDVMQFYQFIDEEVEEYTLDHIVEKQEILQNKIDKLAKALKAR